jgi:tetratricopeptide (TPR) repeat protein
MPINESLTRYIGSLQQLDEDFANYARDYAAKIAPDLDWDWDQELAKLPLDDTEEWLTDHPRNYQAMTQYARLAIEAGEYEPAERVLLELRELHPEDREGTGTLALLGLLYRRTGDEQKEAEVFSELARLNDRALEVYARLMELDAAAEDWQGVRQNANRYLSVQPVLPFGHEQLAKAAERLSQSDELATALSALLEMDPIDPAEIHYRTAKAHQGAGDPAKAKRHVLMALEHAPRYRDAQQLLLELVEPKVDSDTPIETSITAGGL